MPKSNMLYSWIYSWVPTADEIGAEGRELTAKDKGREPRVEDCNHPYEAAAWYNT